MKRTITTILVTAAISFVALPAMANISNNQQDKLGYTMGVETGMAFKAHGVNINPSAYKQGFDDAMAGKPYQMTDQAMKTTLMAFRKEAVEKYKAQAQQASGQNSQQGAAFLSTNKSKPGVKTTASGLQYKIIKAGSGTPPALTDTVTVNYSGSLINGTVFDSSYKRGQPATFPVGGVIKGWQEALTMMKPGAVWMLYIPANLAYGAAGAPGAIGPNQTLIFKVNLISVKH